MINKIIWDVFICMALLGRLWDGNWFLLNLSRMCVVLIFITTGIAVMALLAMIHTRGIGKKAFSKKEVERCNNVFQFRIYEPFSDVCIAFSLCAIGHYVIAGVYFIVGSLIRGIKYNELKEYEDEENGSKID